MKVKPPFLDYEPLKRPHVAGCPSDEVISDDLSFERSKTTVTENKGYGLNVSSEGWPASTELGSEIKTSFSNPPATRSLKKETWIHKHGHSISYVGIFIFTALVFFRPYELSPSLRWLSSSAFWIALATLLIFAITQLSLENTITARPKEVRLVLLLALAGALSIPFALEPKRAFDSFFEFLKAVLIFLVLINVVRTERRMKRLWILILVATCYLSISAIIDYRSGILALRGQRIEGAIGGLFDNPNDLALHLVTMFPIAVSLVFVSRHRLAKVLFSVVAVLIVGGIMVTFSRSGFLALTSAGVLLLWKLVRSSRWLLLLLIPTVLTFFILFAPGGYGTRLSTTGDDSSMARFDDFKRSVFIALRHPVFGVGMDNYVLFSNANKSSHNAYTQVAAEMGAAAAIIYILFIVAPFRGLRRIEEASHPFKSKVRFVYYASTALQASLVGYMVASFFASVAYLWYIYYLVAYAVCLRRIYDSTRERDLTIVPIPQ